MRTVIEADSGGRGTLTFRNPALTNTATAVATGKSRIYGIHVQNPNTADAWLHLYDVATSGVTVGTTTPKTSYWVPGGAGIDERWSVPGEYNTAMTVAASTTATGGTAPSTGLVVNIFYQG